MKKSKLLKKTIESIDRQFIGSALEKLKFKIAFYSHYFFKAVGTGNSVKFPKAKFGFQNVILEARPDTIDFWACLESYEPDLTYFLMDVVKKKKGTFIDVGGHIGRFTTLMAKNEWDVITFEPLDMNYQAILNNLQLNHCSDRAKIYKAGLGDANSTETIYFNPHELGEASLVHSNKRSDMDLVKILKFDDFMQDKKFSGFCVVKIDIEGNEEKAVEGMKNFISENNPLLIIELWGTSKSLIPFLESLGYKRLHVFWYIDSAHGKYMDEMKKFYRLTNMHFDHKGELIRK